MRGTSLKDAIPRPTFSATWQGKLRPSFSGTYQIGLGHQECDSCPGQVNARLYVDGKLMVEESRKAATGAGVKTASLPLDGGKEYAVRIDYGQVEGGSGVELVWAPPPQPLLEEAVQAAKQADAVVLCLGLNSRLEGEELKMAIPGFAGGDRISLIFLRARRNCSKLSRNGETGGGCSVEWECVIGESRSREGECHS